MAASKKIRKFKWWYACLIALAVFIGFIVVVFVGVFAGTSGAVAETEDFFARIAAGEDLAAVYEDTTELFQENTTLPVFVQIIETYPMLSDVESFTFNNRSIETTSYGPTAELSGTVYSTSGDSAPVEIQVIKEDGEWKVTYFALTSE